MKRYILSPIQIIVVCLQDILDNIYQILTGCPTFKPIFSFTRYHQSDSALPMELIPIEGDCSIDSDMKAGRLRESVVPGVRIIS